MSIEVVLFCVASYLQLSVPWDLPEEMVYESPRMCERYPGAQDPRTPVGDGEPWTCEALVVETSDLDGLSRRFILGYPSWPPKKRQRAFAAAWYVVWYNRQHYNFPRMWEAADACRHTTPIATERSFFTSPRSRPLGGVTP